MNQHTVRVYPSAEPLPKTDQLAWKLAEVATAAAPIDPAAAEMVGNRVIDNASTNTRVPCAPDLVGRPA